MKIELSSYNSEQDEEANNKLTIEDDTSKINNNEKNIQINKSHQNSIILTPQEQFKNFQNYRFFNKYGILFCKIGNILACNFDEKNNNSPKICIGPHWYLSIVSNILITVLLITMYKCLIDSEVEFYNKIIYVFLSFLVYFFFNRCALINPGIVQNNKMDSNNTEFCAKCQVFYSPDKKVEHCNMCNVCVEKMDHHCVWVGKCVGKNNIFSFYSMLTSIGIVYGFIIYLAFFQYSNKVSKKIKTK